MCILRSPDALSAGASAAFVAAASALNLKPAHSKSKAPLTRSCTQLWSVQYLLYQAHRLCLGLKKLPFFVSSGPPGARHNLHEFGGLLHAQKRRTMSPLRKNKRFVHTQRHSYVITCPKGGCTRGLVRAPARNVNKRKLAIRPQDGSVVSGILRALAHL